MAVCLEIENNLSSLLFIREYPLNCSICSLKSETIVIGGGGLTFYMITSQVLTVILWIVENKYWYILKKVFLCFI